MRTRVVVAGLFGGSLMLHTAAADATVRSFFSPRLDGNRLGFCLESGQHCGKAVADAWCRFNGYDEAILYQREAIAEGTPALYPDSGARCSGDCLGFREIKCRRAD